MSDPCRLDRASPWHPQFGELFSRDYLVETRRRMTNPYHLLVQFRDPRDLSPMIAGLQRQHGHLQFAIGELSYHSLLEAMRIDHDRFYLRFL